MLNALLIMQRLVGDKNDLKTTGLCWNYSNIKQLIVNKIFYKALVNYIN